MGAAKMMMAAPLFVGCWKSPCEAFLRVATNQLECYRGNVTKITQMVPEYSPQRGNPWKGFGPRGFLYSFLMVYCYCNTHSHFSRKNVTPTHTEFVHKVTFFYLY